MLNVSTEYRTKIDAHARATRALIALDFLPAVEAQATVTASSEMIGYPAVNLLRNRISLDETKGTGSYLPEYIKESFQGWRSAVASDGNKVFATPVTIELTYAQSITTSNFWVVGTREEYITDFTFSVYNSTDTLVLEEVVTGNNAAIWNPIVPLPIECKRVVLSIRGNSISNKEALLLNVGLVDALVLTDEELADFELLEELTSDEALPFGGVSSNMFSFTVNNRGFIFSPANLKGPLVGLLQSGIKVTAYSGLQIVPNEFEYVPLGTFTVAEWSAPSQSTDASIVAYDRLFDLKQEPVPMLRIEQNVTVAILFARLFEALGLTSDEYEIDSKINNNIPFGFVPQGLVGDALLGLSQAGLCHVIVDRLNKVHVRATDPVKVATVNWTDDRQILTFENPEKLNSVYGKLSVGINAPSARRTIDLASMSNIEIAPGMDFLQKAEFSKSPVTAVEEVAIRNSIGAIVGDVSYGTHHISLSIDNPTETPENLTIDVKGVYVHFVKREITAEIANTKVKKQLEINNELVQTSEHAQAIMDEVLPLINDSFAFFELETRGNPSLELGDIVQFSANTGNIDTEFIQIYRTVLKYSGSIDGAIVGRRVK